METESNRFTPALTITSRHYRYADLILFGKKRRKETMKR